MKVSDKPLVSVLIQTYRQEKYIRACLEGVMRQKTNFTFEVCLGVDVSDDKTEAICRAYALDFPETIKLVVRDPRDKVILYGQPIGRYNFTQNILAARGEFVAIIEGDDYWTDMRKLQKQVAFLRDNPDVNLCCTNRKVWKMGEVVSDENIEAVLRKSGGKPFEVTGENFFADYCVSTCTCMYRRNALDLELVRAHPTAFKDIFLFYSLILRGRGFLLPDVTTVYRIHEGGTWSMQSELRKVRANAWTIKGMAESWVGESDFFKKKHRKTMKGYLRVAAKNFSILDCFRAAKWWLA